MGASPTVDGPRRGEEEGDRILGNVSGGFDYLRIVMMHVNIMMMTKDLFQKNVVDYIRIKGNLADTYSDEEIHRAVGILRWKEKSNHDHDGDD